MEQFYPLAYLLTFRTYGTWLPGDPRGWRQRGDGFLAPLRPGSPPLLHAAEALQRWPTVILCAPDADEVRRSIEGTTVRRGWRLHALYVASNHVHVALSAAERAVVVMAGLKACAGRDLRARNGIASERPVWARGGHHRLILSHEALARAVEYITAHERTA